MSCCSQLFVYLLNVLNSVFAMKKSTILLFGLVGVFVVCFSSFSEDKAKRSDEYFDVPEDTGGRPVIGIAWRTGIGASTYRYWGKTIRQAGGYPVLLKQVKSRKHWYDSKDKILMSCMDSIGMLLPKCAKTVKKKRVRSNAKKVMKGIDAVVFTGGEDISTTLFAHPIPPLGSEGCNATRDISDYLLMKYCLDKDIPIFCICRGEQMLGVVSGASLIQDIPLYCKEIGVENQNVHRMAADAPHRTYARHNINIVDRNSHLYNIVGSDTLANVPSWHHQAIRDVAGTPLKVTARTIVDGLDIIEGVERTDKSYAVGVQSHPEIVCVGYFNDGKVDDPCDFEVCFGFWKTFVSFAKNQFEKKRKP